jgi:FkbM family methyltransferase
MITMHVKNYWGRFTHLIRILTIWIRSKIITRRDKQRFLFSLLLVPVRGYVVFLGKHFVSDNKLALPLMPEYVTLVHGVTKAMNLQSDPNILDIGANAGQFGFTWLSLNGGSCISFEPNPYCWSFWEANKISLGLKGNHWKLVRSGVGEKLSNVELSFVPGKSAQGSISTANATHGLLGVQTAVSSQVQIEPITKLMVDNLGRNGSHFDLIKVDVEGAEVSAIKGLKEVSFDFILVEVVEDREFGSNSVTIREEICLVTGRSVREVWSDNPIGDNSLRNILYRID